MIHQCWKIVVLCFALTGCGFHLRGPVQLAPPLHQLYLQSSDTYAPLTQNLQNALRLSGVTLKNSAATAQTVLILGAEQQGSQLQSINPTLQTRVYTLTLAVTFQINDNKGRVLIAPQTINESRTLNTTSDQMLGASNEAATLYQSMRSAIIFDIMNHLSSQQISQGVQVKK